jgi:hypothetical protein
MARFRIELKSRIMLLYPFFTRQVVVSIVSISVVNVLQKKTQQTFYFNKITGRPRLTRRQK